MEFDNTNRGVLFKNDRKDNESQPDYTGKLNVNGGDFDLSAWIKEAKNGRKFFSVSIKPPFNKQETQAPSKHQTQKQNGFVDDDVPFN